MKKIISIILIAALITASLGVLTACPGKNKDVDNTKTQLNVGVSYAGFKDEWVKTWARGFEEMYAETELEPGKKGVQVWVNSHPSAYVGNTLVDTIDSSTQDIFFTESVINMQDYIGKSSVLNITDIVEEELTAYGEDESIADKMEPQLKAYYETTNGYYMLPFYDCFFGINYDVDLFEKQSLYFKDGGGWTATPATNGAAGPDGDLTTTFDNGLPATYEQFYQLMDRMKEKGLTPFIWMGKGSGYPFRILEQLKSDYLGREQTMIKFAGEGEASLVTAINPATSSSGKDIGRVTTAKRTLSSTNISEFYKTPGNYYALQFAYNLVKDTTNYHTHSFSPSLDHLDAQSTFLYSKYQTKQIGMLFDGNWWMGEASGKFAEMAGKYGEEDSINSRRFGFMPLPKATADNAGVFSIQMSNSPACFIRSSIDSNKVNAAKKFLQYCFTNKSIVQFVQTTNTTLPYSFTMTDEERDSLAYYGKQMLYIKENADLIYPYSDTDYFKSNISSLHGPGAEYWYCRYGTSNLNYPLNVFRDRDLTVADYFNGMLAYRNLSL